MQREQRCTTVELAADNLLLKAIASCSPADSFCRRTGRILAARKLLAGAAFLSKEDKRRVFAAVCPEYAKQLSPAVAGVEIMSIDPSKLTPAPWTPTVESDRGYKGETYGRFYWPTFNEAPFSDFTGEDAEARAVVDAAFLCLARSAFDVMMRRGWNPYKSPITATGWRVNRDDGDYFTNAEDGSPQEWDDPFTALVEADRLENHSIGNPT